MDPLGVAVLAICLLGLLALGVPVGFALGLSGVFAIASVGTSFLIQLPLTVSKSLSDVVLISIPLFVLMGEILYRGRIGQQLFAMAEEWVGRVRGGAGMSAVFAFTVFAAIVGSSMASVLTIGKIAIPEMARKGYSKELQYGLTAVGGSLGILIPPSIPLIIYASLTDTSPAKLFIAGILPGLFIAVLLAIWAAWKSPGTEEAPPFALGRAALATLRAVPDLSLPVIILGGIYLGVYTPTEAAAIGVVLSMALTMVLRRTLKVRELLHVLMESTRTTVRLLTIVLGALVFGSALTFVGLTDVLGKVTASSNLPQWVILLLFFAAWTVMGMFLEVISIILISVPLFYPIAAAAQIDPIWFGIFLVINMEISVITPPVGMNLFAVHAIVPHERLGTITKAAIPSIAVLLVGALAICIWPQLALALVGR